MESKALPPAKINPQKLLGGSSVSSIVKKISVKPSTGEDNIFIIRKQVIQVKDLLNTNILLKRQEENKKRKSEEQKKFSEKEEGLEKSKETSKEKIKLPSVPRLGFLERIKQFIFNIILGRIAIALLPQLPKLSGIVGTIVKVQDTIIDWTGKILDGLVTFVDKGYEAYDQSKKILKGIGGDNFVKVFNGFTGAIDKVIEASIIAAIAFGELGGDGGGGVSPKKGFDATGRKVATGVQERYLQRYGEKKFAERFGQKALQRIAARGAEQTVERGVLKTLVKRIPIVGALLDFALNYFVFHEPLGESAFRAAGSSLTSVLGGIIGSVFPGPGTLIGAALGGWAGDAVASALYDMIFKNKKPNQTKVQGRAQGGVVTRGGRLQTGPSRTVKKTPKREVSVTPTPLKPGSDVGGEKNITKIFPKRDEKDANKDKTVNPLGYIEGVYDKTSKINYFGPLFGLVLKKLSGDKVDKVDYKNVGKSLNSWMSNTFGSNTMTIGGFAEGGEVNSQMFMSGEDLTNVIAKSVEESVSSKLDKVIDDLEKQLMLKPKDGEKEKVPTSGQQGVEGDEDFSGATGAEKTMHYLISQGLTGAQAAGIAGNLQQESGFDPDADNGSHHGIAQWDKQNRWPRVSAYIRSVGKDPNSLEGQLVGLKWEAQQRGDWNAIKGASSAREASAIWLERFERSGEKPGMKGFENRMAFANDLLAKYGSYVPTTSTKEIELGKGYGSEGSKIAGELGKYIYKVLKSPQQFQAVTEHPDFGGVDNSAHAQNSYHKYGRAIDIGAYSWEQGPILKAIADFNKMKGVRPVELLKAGDPGHDNHVHVAYKEGGKVKGLTRAILGEEGPEFVIDADSTRALEKNYPGFLDALNKADYSGALKVLQSYASYESSAPIQVSVDESMIPVLFPTSSSSSQKSTSIVSYVRKDDYMASSYKKG